MKQVQFIDKNAGMIAAWQAAFNGVPGVYVRQADFFFSPVDCIVSPANSFGFMDGGLDMAISRHIGWETQTRLQQKIKDFAHGELLVGQALTVETGHPDIPWCISAPTMRVPMILTNTVNVYLAAKAAFREFKSNGTIKTLRISGMGTGVGRVPFGVCAVQMRKAYGEVFLNEGNFPQTWDQAQAQHQLLYTDNPTDLQFK